jgi:hypothetical protein
MEMIISRNLSSHTYDEALADSLVKRIIEIYLPLFATLREKLQNRVHE